MYAQDIREQRNICSVSYTHLNIQAADSAHNVKAGDNAVWNGTAWDILSGTIDLSGFISATDVITNEEIDAIWNS